MPLGNIRQWEVKYPFVTPFTRPMWPQLSLRNHGSGATLARIHKSERYCPPLLLSPFRGRFIWVFLYLKGVQWPFSWAMNAHSMLWVVKKKKKKTLANNMVLPPPHRSRPLKPVSVYTMSFFTVTLEQMTVWKSFSLTAVVNPGRTSLSCLGEALPRFSSAKVFNVY